MRKGALITLNGLSVVALVLHAIKIVIRHLGGRVSLMSQMNLAHFPDV